jgi:DNA modification methylase
MLKQKNNDGSNTLNKATYSSELCEKLLNIYCPTNGLVYDPFMGTGTTAVACKRMDLNCIGSELSEAQCEFANNRLDKITM